MNKYLIKGIDVDINLECDDDIYYPTEVIKNTYIDADSPKQAFDDGPVELTFTVTEVPDMIPEEF